ncbi:hypothetical protein AN216_10870 [Streptomyces oceani]|uniref:RNA polymerase sigma factor 70 region 4 type 2 domain-containing protein n=1 Tax=Streptomyces oceani TaxID=1075402 RepID=A0A1E7KI37_9ACTN|nr:hypothetical protein AN216_10870 [Streptomyces oceani]
MVPGSADPAAPASGPEEQPDTTAAPAIDTTAHSSESAFDRLYETHAHALACQAYVLSGHRDIAERAVAHAFHRAWEHWPEVSAHPDPGCWLRATAHDYALSPWHLFHPARRGPQAHPGPPADRATLQGLSQLPGSYRRALLLHHGLGLDIADTATETEASLPAAFGRVTNARVALAEHTPELRSVAVPERASLITTRLRTLLAAHPARTIPAGTVRAASERATRLRTRAALGLAALVTVAVAAAWVTADDSSRRAPEGPPGATSSTLAPGGAGQPGVYAPELRSSNDRVRLDEHPAPEEHRAQAEGGSPDGERTNAGTREGQPSAAP